MLYINILARGEELDASARHLAFYRGLGDIQVAEAFYSLQHTESVTSYADDARALSLSLSLSLSCHMFDLVVLSFIVF